MSEEIYKTFYEGKDLKPCPFCGESPNCYIQDWDCDRSLQLFIRCNYCPAEMSGFVASGKEALTHEKVDEVIADWNKRV